MNDTAPSPGTRPSPELSVIMAMRNAATTVQAQLDALAASVTDTTWELIVSDNGSRDGSRSIVERAARTFPVPLRVIDSDARPGISGARNAAVEVSRGSKLAFCDADDVVFPGWIEGAARALDDADVVCGFSHDLRDPLDEDAPLMNPGGIYFNAAGPAITGGNCAVRREVYLEVGGLDETLGRFGHEDSELSIRLGKAGYTPVPAPAMRIHYRDSHGIKTQVRKTCVRSGAEVMLWHRHPDVYGQMLDLDLHRRQVAGWAAWHLQLRRQGQGMSLHDMMRDGITRLARYRAYRRWERHGGVPEPRFMTIPALDDPRVPAEAARHSPND